MDATTTREQAAILDAIRTVTTYNDLPWAGMGAIRDESGLNRQTFNRVMAELVVAQLVNVAPEDVQCSLTSADRHNALHIGGEDKHLVCLA